MRALALASVLALAAFSLALPVEVSGTPFQPVAVEDIAAARLVYDAIESGRTHVLQ